MYHNYILQHMSHSRLEDAHRQAKGDSVCKQMANRKREDSYRASILEFVQHLVKVVSGRAIKAQG